jgi:hypothetical protein
VRLPVKKAFHPTNCTVWASPQATITIPLSKVAALVKAIQSTEGKGPGVALTGDNDKNSDGTAKHWRMGLRSLALYRARDAVDKALKQLDAKRPRLILTDKREVNKTTLSQDLRGFLILLATYLWTSELTYQFDPAQARFDYEPFAKAYLPVNVKASFSEIFRKLLTPADQLVFKEVFAVGSVPSKGLGLLAPQLSTLLRQITQGAARERLFRLARPAATAADGTRKLFPPGPKELGLDSVYERQKAEFGSVPTWDDLVEHSLNSTHRGWGDRLMVPLSKPIEVNKTTPRVALELRRIGFNAVFDSRWEGLMRRVFKMVSQLNA